MKTFDQLIITTGFLASASPAMADEKPEADSGRPNILSSFPDDHTSQAWGIYGGIRERIREEREYPPPGRPRGACLTTAFARTRSPCPAARLS